MTDPTIPEAYIHDIPPALAASAHAGTSFVPDKRGDQERQSYANTLATDYTNLSRYATTDEKRADLEREFTRYRAGYRSRYVQYLAARSRCMSTMITGGSNFPTARNAKRTATSDKRTTELLEFRERALAAITKVLRPELRPVMAGDDDAVERLADKIARAESLQELMRNANAAIRANAKRGAEAQVAALVALGISEKNARGLLEKDFAGRIGFANYQLTNNNANIRRMKERLAQISKAKTEEVTEAKGEHGTIEDNPGDNRVRLFFPGKPSADVRARLKSAGFRWTPSLGCWQAYRNQRTIALAKSEAGSLTEGADIAPQEHAS